MNSNKNIRMECLTTNPEENVWACNVHSMEKLNRSRLIQSAALAGKQFLLTFIHELLPQRLPFGELSLESLIQAES